MVNRWLPATAIQFESRCLFALPVPFALFHDGDYGQRIAYNLSNDLVVIRLVTGPCFWLLSKT